MTLIKGNEASCNDRSFLLLCIFRLDLIFLRSLLARHIVSEASHAAYDALSCTRALLLNFTLLTLLFLLQISVCNLESLFLQLQLFVCDRHLNFKEAFVFVDDFHRANVGESVLTLNFLLAIPQLNPLIICRTGVLSSNLLDLV